MSFRPGELLVFRSGYSTWLYEYSNETKTNFRINAAQILILIPAEAILLFVGFVEETYPLVLHGDQLFIGRYHVFNKFE